MQPTINRAVHYQSFGTPAGEFEPECRAAIITEVESNEIVGLCVLNPTGMFFRQGVHLDDEGKAGGTWHWPERV